MGYAYPHHRGLGSLLLSYLMHNWLEENSSKTARLPMILTRVPSLASCFPQQDPTAALGLPFLPELLHFFRAIWKGKGHGSSSHGAECCVVLGPLKPAHHSTRSYKYGLVSLREGGGYAQHGRNVTTPCCTLPYLETDKINPTESQLLLVLPCVCSGWHTAVLHCLLTAAQGRPQRSCEIPAAFISTT